MRSIRLAGVVALAVLSATLSEATSADEVKLGGTGAALATMRALAQALGKSDPSLRVTLVPNLGTSGSIKAVAAGAIDIALATRGPSEQERASGLTGREYARTPFVLAASKGRTLPLTPDTIAEIYSASRANWPDGTPIRLVLRQATDSDTTTLAKLSPAVKSAVEASLRREGMILGLTDQDAADRIAKLPGGLGSTTLALIVSENRPLDPLPINGVVPSVASLEDGSYSLAKSLYFVHRVNASEPAKRFIAFVGSEPGRKILRENGQTPR